MCTERCQHHRGNKSAAPSPLISGIPGFPVSALDLLGQELSAFPDALTPIHFSFTLFILLKTFDFTSHPHGHLFIGEAVDHPDVAESLSSGGINRKMLFFICGAAWGSLLVGLLMPLYLLRCSTPPHGKHIALSPKGCGASRLPGSAPPSPLCPVSTESGQSAASRGRECHPPVLQHPSYSMSHSPRAPLTFPERPLHGRKRKKPEQPHVLPKPELTAPPPSLILLPAGEWGAACHLLEAVTNAYRTLALSLGQQGKPSSPS